MATYAEGLHEGFPGRCRQMIEAQRGKPFVKGDIEYDWIERGNFTRRYAHSITTFAMQAFHLDEGVDKANEALIELCQHYLGHRTDLLEAHSFHWSGAIYNRLWRFFGPAGSVAADRMSMEAQTQLLDVMWAWASEASEALDPSTDHIGRFPNSENHHAMGIVTTWGFCDVLRQSERHRDKAFSDGRDAGDHYSAWSIYLRAYFRARAGKGQSVEIASKNYNAHTIQMWYNVADFAEDEGLREAATSFLDLYWATWSEEQIDGVRGGGKTRIYQGPATKTASDGAIQKMAGLYFDKRVDESMSAQDWIVVTSAYRMPLLVMNLALDVEGRGEYEVTQRCMGLKEPGWERIPNPPVIPFGINGLREDFGGFLRYSYCTPDFVIGTLMVEARPNDEWTGVAAQNRWQGVMFRGHPYAAIVPECLAVDRHMNMLNHPNTMNQHWSVQKKGALITQKLLNPDYSIQTGHSRVWISGHGLSEPQERDGWVFVEAEGAIAGIYILGGYAWDPPEEGAVGRWMRCEDDMAPIVIEVVRKSDVECIDEFAMSAEARTPDLSEDKITFQTFSEDSLALHTDFSSLPEINGSSLDLAPDKVYDSPYVTSEWDSGKVEIQYGGEIKRLVF